MGILKRLGALIGKEKTETRMTLEELVLEFGGTGSDINKSQAMNIPSVASCVELISNTVATLPIILYTDTGDSVRSTEDHRVGLLNDDTGDMLDGFQFKKAIVEDYLLKGNGYAYINRSRNKVKSIHRVDSDHISINESPDPIFKDYDIFINGNRYRDFEFIKVTRKTKNGVTGKGVIEENNMILSVAYNALVFENVLVKTGGNKKGFLKSQSRLEQKAMDQLKAAWKNLYGNNEDNVMVLNQGLDFQEASNTSVEMQLNENKKTNSAEICKLFNVPVALLEGKATEQEYNNFIKTAILPILKAMETALNKDLLLPSEKKSFYFAFDTKDLLKGDMEKRYKAYELAVKNGIMQIDEVRYREDLAPLNLDFIKLGLQDVLYNPGTKEIYTPNTNKTNSIEGSDAKGGEEDAHRGKEQPSNS